MTTSEGSVNSNKAALRASLKKEDESLAERIEDPNVTELLAPPSASAAPAEPPSEEAVRHLSQAAATGAKSGPKKKGQSAVPVEERSSGKGTVRKVKPERAKGPAAAASKREKPAVSAKNRAAAAKTGAANKTEKPPVAAQEETNQHVDGGRKARGQSAKGREKRPAETAPKPEKIVRFALDLLKSEAVAIESLRSELSKAAGWTASRSDILRAGVRLFAGQTLDRRKELLTALTRTAKDQKKG